MPEERQLGLLKAKGKTFIIFSALPYHRYKLSFTMTLSYDLEFRKTAAPYFDNLPNIPKSPLHDVESRRARFVNLGMQKPPELVHGVESEIYKIPTPDGYQLSIYRLKKVDDGPGLGPAVFHCHGGGYITMDPLPSLATLSKQVLDSGVQAFSVDYRLAPEHPYPTPLEDCWTGLTWILSKADHFGIDKTRVAVMGESAGGGLAAALALLARDRELSPPLARQLLVYPMLDDRNRGAVPGKPALWDEDDNATGWAAYLGKLKNSNDVPIFAAPARVEDVMGMPPLYLDVGQLDIFAKEDLEYARKFIHAEIETELHVYPGLPHAFEVLAPNHSFTRLAEENRMRWLRRL